MAKRLQEAGHTELFSLVHRDLVTCVDQISKEILMKPVSRNIIGSALGAGGLLLAVGIAAIGVSLFSSRIVVPAHDRAQKRAYWVSSGYKETLSIPVSVADREYKTIYHHPFPVPYSMSGVIPESPNTKQLCITVSHYKPGKTRSQDVLMDRILIILKNEENEWRYGTWSVQVADGHVIPDASRTTFAFHPDSKWLKAPGTPQSARSLPLNLQ
ncbi:MAG: hypothetical protein JWN14_1491 [Chthonomonadales bacterium]|nr:hypothetical protein [Chthonomonadales bacterium]